MFSFELDIYWVLCFNKLDELFSSVEEFVFNSVDSFFVSVDLPFISFVSETWLFSFVEEESETVSESFCSIISFESLSCS